MNRLRRHEKGAIATIVALLMGFGVVFGVLAIGVDVGNLLWERRQLQNAADAAALSLAVECGKSNCTTTAGNTTAFANANSNDDLSTVVSTCSVNVPGSGLPACATPGSGFTDCPPLPPALASMTNLPYVEVRTASLSGGGSFVQNWFGGISGGADSSQTQVHACSRAALGAPASGTGDVPITFSACDWQHATGGTTGGGGGSYYASPVYNGVNAVGYGGAGQPPWPAAAATPPAQNPGGEVILMSQNPPGGATMPTSCPTWNGHALPGGFGILETVAGDDCQFVEYTHHWMHTSTGNNTSCNLSAMVGHVINLPIFDCTSDTMPGTGVTGLPCTTGNGSNAYYHRVGYAAFYLSGYSINVTGGLPNKVKSLVSNTFPCNGADRCIAGWFLTGELSATAISGPPSGSGSFGAFAVVPAG